MLFGDTSRIVVPFAKDAEIFKFRVWLPHRQIAFQPRTLDPTDRYTCVKAWISPCGGECIEVAALVQEVNLLWMFYAGACNNKPPQIGMAKLIFFIRNKDNGNTWWISNVEVFSNEKEPYLKRWRHIEKCFRNCIICTRAHLEWFHFE